MDRRRRGFGPVGDLTGAGGGKQSSPVLPLAKPRRLPGLERPRSAKAKRQQDSVGLRVAHQGAAGPEVVGETETGSGITTKSPERVAPALGGGGASLPTTPEGRADCSSGHFSGSGGFGSSAVSTPADNAPDVAPSPAGSVKRLLGAIDEPGLQAAAEAEANTPRLGVPAATAEAGAGAGTSARLGAGGATSFGDLALAMASHADEGDAKATAVHGNSYKVPDDGAANKPKKKGSLKRKLSFWSAADAAAAAAPSSPTSSSKVHSQAKQRWFRIAVMGRAADNAERRLRMAFVSFIFFGCMSVMAESVVLEGGAATAQQAVVILVELLTTIVFGAEYGLRAWACSAGPDFDHTNPRRSRLKFLLKFSSVLDVIFILPILVLPAVGPGTYFENAPSTALLEVVRIIRGMRLVKFGRYSPSIQLLWTVVLNKGDELVSAAVICGALVMLLSLLVYVAERRDNGDEFRNMGAAMWWGVVTLTTVGYGDMSPITNSGRGLGALGAVLGIGLFTLPAGIIASGFLDLRNEQKRKTEKVMAAAKRVRWKMKKMYAFLEWKEHTATARAVGAAASRLKRPKQPEKPFLVIMAEELLKDAGGDLATALRVLLQVYDGDTDGAAATAAASGGTTREDASGVLTQLLTRRRSETQRMRRLSGAGVGLDAAAGGAH